MQILEEQNVDFQIVEYLKNSLTVADLKSLAEKLNLRPAEFIRKSALKELNLKDQLDDDEIYRQIEANPKRMERPIIVKGDKAVIGRPPENLLKII